MVCTCCEAHFVCALLAPARVRNEMCASVGSLGRARRLLAAVASGLEGPARPAAARGHRSKSRLRNDGRRQSAAVLKAKTMPRVCRCPNRVRAYARALTRAAVLVCVASCNRAPIPRVVSTVLSPDGRDQAVIARSPTRVLDATGASLCVYDEYVGSANSNPTHIASYKLSCNEPPPRAVWRAYNPDGHSFDVHLIDATGRELDASDRTWQMATFSQQ